MKKIIFVPLAVVGLTISVGAQKKAVVKPVAKPMSQKTVLKDMVDSASYAIGTAMKMRISLL